MSGFNLGDFVEVRGLEWPNGSEVENGWGVVVDRDEDENPMTGTCYQVMIWNGEGKYQGNAWCGVSKLGEKIEMKKRERKLEGKMGEGRFKIGDRVRMVDGMEGRLLNSWGMMFEWGVVKEVEGNEVRVGFRKDGMERVEYWCLEEQLERVERGESGK